VAGKSGQAVLDVRGVTDLAGLAVADDVDAGGTLVAANAARSYCSPFSFL